MIEQATLNGALESILGPDGVLHGEAATSYAVDGLRPKSVALPASVEQVAQVLRLAHQERAAVIPWGGGTTMHIGNTPARYDIAISLSRLDRVLEHEPADLTASVQAGCTLAALGRHLADGGQFLPLDPPGGDTATVGGVLATGASGPSRHAYGSARDLVIGLKVVTADGRVTRAGGKVVKNVAGYDLCKLYIGSLGTLGVIVEATFKVAPLPKAQASALVSFADAGEACRYAAELASRGLSLRALELMNRAAQSQAGLEARDTYLLALWLSGTAAGVERSRRQAEELATEAAGFEEADHSDDLWERLRRLATAQRAQLLCKASVPPSRLPQAVAAAEALGGEPASPAGRPAILARPTLGLVYIAWPEAAEAGKVVADLRTAVADLGGSLTVEACPPSLKAEIDVFGQARSDLALMRSVKEHFDPNAILNPGRYLGRL